MYSKIVFLCVILVLHNTLGLPRNAGLDPTHLAGAVIQPVKDVSEKQIKPVAGLFGAPFGAFSQATHGLVKRATDDEKSGGQDKIIQPIFGFFGEQLDTFSKALGAIGGSSGSKKEKE